MRQLDFIKKYYRYMLNKNNERISSIWVFGEWFGKRIGDNSTYYVNYIAENYPDIQLYWLCHRDCETSALNSRIQVLDYSTKDAVDISRKAAVAVMGEGISDLSFDISNYLGNAIKVNLWHGIPWKKIGYDADKEIRSSLINKIHRKMYNYDLFESPSDEYTNHIITGFNTRKNNIVHAGQPRNWLFFDIENISKHKTRFSGLIGTGSPVIIVYLPTFRDAHTKPFSFTDIKDVSFFTWLEENNIYIIQKAHAAETGSFSSGSNYVINMTDISAQELMAASDMLVTDYSSCFFDYLLLDRPIVHYLYDYDYYKNKDRGLYYDKEDVVCGSAPETEEELIKAIKENFENPALYHELRMERKEKFMTYESPDSCEIITQRIFEELKKRGMELS